MILVKIDFKEVRIKELEEALEEIYQVSITLQSQPYGDSDYGYIIEICNKVLDK